MLAPSFYNVNKVMESPGQKKNTKLICTIGPACLDEAILKDMILSGMNVARLNFSHGDHESMKKTIELLKKVRTEMNSNLAILLDTKGPEIRTGFLKHGKPIALKKGQDLEIVSDYEFLGDTTKIACSYHKLSSTVKIGDSILCADGSLSLSVTQVNLDSVKVEVQNDCLLGERKNMNLPKRKVDLPTITAKDEKDINAFAKYVDLIAVSFVQGGDDIDLVKKALGKESDRVKTIAKIENYEGIYNFESIMEVFDGIMIARGDMGMEIPISKVPLVQKSLIKQCNEAGKFVVVATQMLESMTGNARPTRAEATDVANAVLDGADCVMLSGETAGGKFPVQSVRMMTELCCEVERALDYTAIRDRCKFKQNKTGEIADNIVGSSSEGNVTCIVIRNNMKLITEIARFKPSCPVVLCVTSKDISGREMQAIEAFNRGISCFRVEESVIEDTELLKIFLKDNGYDIERINQVTDNESNILK